jgi:hypothetical protein
MDQQWKFLYKEWPQIKPSKYHRSDIKPVKKISSIKDIVLQRLGIIPVFFFLVVIFATQDYPGPYRNMEKGLLILYQLLEGCSLNEMSVYIPKSSYYDIFRKFYERQGNDLDKRISIMLISMFSTIDIRIHSAQKNPPLFRQVTLMIDGHDTRASLIGEKTENMYSYKLKKSGLRIQVCIDINGMVLFTSKSAPCKDNSDGVMFVKMKIDKYIDKFDCIALDGGYPLHLNKIISNTELDMINFCIPIRKSKGIELSKDESTFNRMFGSFRSKIEGTFGELSTTFKKLTDEGCIRVTDHEVFTIQFKLACLLLNVKKFVILGGIQSQPHHSSWLSSEFDYWKDENLETYENLPSLTDSRSNAQEMLKLQRKFLSIELGDDEDMDEIDEPYEIEEIVNHRGQGKFTEYLVKWKGYDEVTWQGVKSFDTTECIDEYWKRKEEDV